VRGLYHRVSCACRSPRSKDRQSPGNTPFRRLVGSSQDGEARADPLVRHQTPPAVSETIDVTIMKRRTQPLGDRDGKKVGRLCCIRRRTAHVWVDWSRRCVHFPQLLQKRLLVFPEHALFSHGERSIPFIARHYRASHPRQEVKAAHRAQSQPVWCVGTQSANPVCLVCRVQSANPIRFVCRVQSANPIRLALGVQSQPVCCVGTQSAMLPS